MNPRPVATSLRLWLLCSCSVAAACGAEPSAPPSNEVAAGSAGSTTNTSSGGGGVAAGTSGVASGGGGIGSGGGGMASGGSAGGVSGGAGGGGTSAGSGGANGGSAGTAAGGSGGSAGSGEKPLDVTFFVVADTHADPVLQDDLLAHARSIDAVAQSGAWPAKIDGQDTHFKGGPVGKPRGVVFVGDLTGWGTSPTEIPTFEHYYEAGRSPDSIAYPGFVGLGNHDVASADRGEPLASTYRALQWAHVDARHAGPNAPVKVTSFDAASHAYSFDFDGVHLVQLHRFAGDVEYGLGSSIGFLQKDLKEHASDGRPVILFHHYGMDTFGTEDRWWTQAQRDIYRNSLNGYHVSAVIVGHSHAAFNYGWEDLRVFQVNNAKAENGTGNNDGNGSFTIVRVTRTQLDVMTCRWLDVSGKYELVAPFYSGPL